MLKIELVDNPFTPIQVVRPIQIADRSVWPGDGVESNAALVGPALFDVYIELLARGEGDFVSVLVASVEKFMRANGSSDEDVRAMHSSIWRSAHKFITRNISYVDRGTEIEDLARILKVKS